MTHPTTVTGGPSGPGQNACQTSARYAHGTSMNAWDVTETAATPKAGSIHKVDVTDAADESVAKIVCTSLHAEIICLDATLTGTSE